MDSQDAIAMYNGGEPMDSETREYMKASLENALRFAKLKAKEKFTPKNTANKGMYYGHKEIRE